jgi:DNA-damage-inducible protein J
LLKLPKHGQRRPRKALPFEPLVPNEETIAAMLAARRGDVKTVTLDELQAVLDADD